MLTISLPMVEIARDTDCGGGRGVKETDGYNRASSGSLKGPQTCR